MRPCGSCACLYTPQNAMGTDARGDAVDTQPRDACRSNSESFAMKVHIDRSACSSVRAW